MEIIIAGAGRVGFRLAKALSPKHNVTIMDKNVEALERIRENIDVLTLPGHVQDPDSYEALRGREVDLFIAVTDSDEVNLVSCIIADEKIRVKRKIIRLRHEFFARSSIAEKSAITDAVFPYSLTAASVKALLDYPKANNVKGFPETPMKLISVRANFHHGEHDVPVGQINSKRVMVVGIDRKKNFHIPTANDAIRHDDMVYLFGAEETVRELCGRFDHKMPRKIRKIVILGADTLGIEIARALSVHGATIKLIEKDLQKCRRAAEILQNNATVINSKYGDFRLYRDEGLTNAQMLIASTANDEENIIKCIEAKEHGIEKVVAINNDIEYYNLMHSLGLVIVRGPKTNAFYSIMETIGSNTAVNEKLFCGGSAICFVRDLNGYRGTILPFVKHNVVSCIVAAGTLHLFDRPLNVEEHCVVISFCARCREEEVRRWINDL
jgi:trk system potassium uptake protein TrkA